MIDGERVPERGGEGSATAIRTVVGLLNEEKDGGRAGVANGNTTTTTNQTTNIHTTPMGYLQKRSERATGQDTKSDRERQETEQIAANQPARESQTDKPDRLCPLTRSITPSPNDFNPTRSKQGNRTSSLVQNPSCRQK